MIKSSEITIKDDDVANFELVQRTELSIKKALMLSLTR
jgi:hypothetical protein